MTLEEDAAALRAQDAERNAAENARGEERTRLIAEFAEWAVAHSAPTRLVYGLTTQEVQMSDSVIVPSETVLAEVWALHRDVSLFGVSVDSHDLVRFTRMFDKYATERLEEPFVSNMDLRAAMARFVVNLTTE